MENIEETIEIDREIEKQNKGIGNQRSNEGNENT
jgi:hypothetical protein